MQFLHMEPSTRGAAFYGLPSEGRMDFNSGHLDELRRCRGNAEAVDEQPGGSPAQWYGHIARQGATAGLPTHPCKRADLFVYLASGPPIDLACAAVLGWGGMHRLNGRRLFGSSNWLDVGAYLRSGEMDRLEAFEAFARLRLDGDLPGMGPAYFTKLIFFLMPRTEGAPTPGYIMDQWTACSINLLLGSDRAILTDAQFAWDKGHQVRSGFYVSDYNTAHNYALFCEAVEALGDELALPPADVELLLLSEGGRQPLRWREYVKKHRQPALR